MSMLRSTNPISSQKVRTGVRPPSFMRSTILAASAAIVSWLLYLGFTGHWSQLWFSPDQMGQRYFRQGKYQEAAQVFQDSQWQGVAWYRAGEFQKAVQYFSLRDTAEAHYNAGNAWLMLGKYEEAVKCYSLAISGRPEWTEAIENHNLAQARAKLVEQSGGDLGDQKIGADKIVFDKSAKNEGQQTETAGKQAMSDAAIQAMWLRRVQTRPADFLRAKFAYQQAIKTGQGD
jgi:Ca-activated chloride channel family protein